MSLLTSLAGAAASPGFWPAKAAAALPADTVVRHVLPNGLLVLVEERPTTDTVALRLTAHVGFRDDLRPGTNALASRLLMQGTARWPTETDLQRAAARVGTTLSRSTGDSLSSVSIRVPSSETELGFALLGEVALNPLLDPQALERQRILTAQDIAQRQTNPRALADDLFRQTLFEGQPLGLPVLGTAESIVSLNVEVVLQHLSRYWCAANLALSIVGQVKVAEAIAYAEQSFSELRTGMPNQRSLPSQTFSAGGRTVQAQTGKNQAQFRVGSVAPSPQEPDAAPARVLIDALSGNVNYALRTRRGLAYLTDATYSTFEDAGAWYILAGVDPGNVSQALEVVRAEIERLRNTPPSLSYMNEQIQYLAGSTTLQAEANAARAENLAEQALQGAETIPEFVQRILRVTQDDLQRVAQDYLNTDRAVTVIVGPASA